MSLSDFPRSNGMSLSVLFRFWLSVFGFSSNHAQAAHYMVAVAIAVECRLPQHGPVAVLRGVVWLVTLVALLVIFSKWQTGYLDMTCEPHIRERPVRPTGVLV